VKTPQWLAEEVAAQGTRVLDGKAARTDALTAMAEAIGAHPEYVAGLIAADASRELSAWLKDNATEDPSAQLDLFPGLPRRMRIAPAKYADTAEMDAAQLDHAKNMLLARTQNAIDGATAAAEHEREVFMAFYDKVRPLLTGGLTVGDVLDRLARAA